MNINNVLLYDNIYVHVCTETSPRFTASNPLHPFLSFVFHALERGTRILNPEPLLLKVTSFGGVRDFSYNGFQIHILCLKIPFIQTKI